MNGLRLNIACGTDIRDDYVNIDVVKKWPLARRACDVLWDGESGEPLPFPDGCAVEVYAGYLLLHLRPRHHDRVLRDIHRVMAPDGLLVVSEVDMAVLMPRWLENPSDQYLSGLLWGEGGELPGVVSEEQRALARYDDHRQGFTEESLRSVLARNGFPSATRVKRHADGVFYELTLDARRC
jgi:hypothetical protein